MRARRRHQILPRSTPFDARQGRWGDYTTCGSQPLPTLNALPAWQRSATARWGLWTHSLTIGGTPDLVMERMDHDLCAGAGDDDSVSGDGLGSLEAAAATPAADILRAASAMPGGSDAALGDGSGDHVEVLSQLRLRGRIASSAAVHAFIGDLRFQTLQAVAKTGKPRFASASAMGVSAGGGSGDGGGGGGGSGRDDTLELATIGVVSTVAVLGSGGSDSAVVGGSGAGSGSRRFVKWQMTDFGTTLPITVLLFGAAADLVAYEPVGSMWAIRQPRVLPDRRPGSSGGVAGGNDQVTLSVSSPGQLLKLGRSPELAFCGGTRHNGSQCNLPVRASLRFCAFHMQQSRSQLMREFASCRGDLSGHTSE